MPLDGLVLMLIHSWWGVGHLADKRELLNQSRVVCQYFCRGVDKKKNLAPFLAVWLVLSNVFYSDTWV